MKSFDRQVATDALEALAENDPELSASIRKMMFIFDDLVQLDASTMGTHPARSRFQHAGRRDEGLPAEIEARRS